MGGPGGTKYPKAKSDSVKWVYDEEAKRGKEYVRMFPYSGASMRLISFNSFRTIYMALVH